MSYPFKRYCFVEPTSGMEEREGGAWVKLEDALKLLADIANLRTELDGVKSENADLHIRYGYEQDSAKAMRNERDKYRTELIKIRETQANDNL